MQVAAFSLSVRNINEASCATAAYVIADAVKGDFTIPMHSHMPEVNWRSLTCCSCLDCRTVAILSAALHYWGQDSHCPHLERTLAKLQGEVGRAFKRGSQILGE